MEAQRRPSIVAIVQGLFSAAWLFGISYVFFVTWREPYAYDEFMVTRLCYVMIIEFFVVHATGFFGAAAAKDSVLTRLVIYGGLTLFYSIFGLAFSAAYGGLFPLYMLLGLILPKMAGVVLRPPGEDTMFMAMAFWACMTALYLLGVFATLIFPIPEWGITPAVIEAQAFTMTGAWPEEPYRVVAFGGFYFAGLGVLTAIFGFLTPSTLKSWAPDTPESRG